MAHHELLAIAGEQNITRQGAMVAGLVMSSSIEMPQLAYHSVDGGEGGNVFPGAVVQGPQTGNTSRPNTGTGGHGAGRPQS